MTNDLPQDRLTRLARAASDCIERIGELPESERKRAVKLVAHLFGVIGDDEMEEED